MLPNRRKIRLPNFDYGRTGSYFITICSHERRNIFGHINGTIICLSPIGSIIWQEWAKSFEMREHYTSHAFIVMPNHCHGLFSIDRSIYDDWNSERIEEFSSPQGDNIASFMRGFKSSVTANAKRILNVQEPIWQSKYHDHVVRNEEGFLQIEHYINSNPANWQKDCFY